MLSKPHRIRKSIEFDLIRSEGERYKALHFMMVIRKLNESQKDPLYKYPRFGFIVTKKIGGAVVRNKVKRWLREAVRQELLSLPDDFEAAIIAFEGIEISNFQEISKEFKDLVEKIYPAK